MESSMLRFTGKSVRKFTEIGAAARWGVAAFHLVVFGMLLLGGSNVAQAQNKSLGKVYASELPVVLDSGLVIGYSRVFGGSEITQIHPFPVNGNTRSPRITSEEDAFITVDVCRSHASIVKALPQSANPEIAATVVEGVMVFVIAVHSIDTPHNHGSHINPLKSISKRPFRVCRVVASRQHRPLGEPIDRDHAVEINLPYSGVLSLCKRNFTTTFPINNENGLDDGRLFFANPT